MDVRLLYFDGCPSWQVAEQRLRLALDQVGCAEVAIIRERVTTIDEARLLRFLGSPTILIDGFDPFATPGAEPAMACRVFASATGLSGSPSVEQLVTALGRTAPTPQTYVDTPDVDGGETSCYAHLLCEECGIVLDGSAHLATCPRSLVSNHAIEIPREIGRVTGPV